MNYDLNEILEWIEISYDKNGVWDASVLRELFEKKYGNIPKLMNESESIKKDVRSLRINIFSQAIEKLCPEFKVHKDNSNTFEFIKRYFYNYPKTPFINSKGILLSGKTGTGKTTLFKLMQFLIVNMQEFEKFLSKKYFYITSANNIVLDFAKNGAKCLEKYIENPKDDGGFNPRNYLIDDFGNEPKNANNFGNALNPLETVILERYELWKSKGIITHFTTNLSAKLIKEQYSERVYKRIFEMTNYVIWNGEDYRSLKPIF